MHGEQREARHVPPPPVARKIAFVRFGDFGAAAARLRSSGEETFHAQRYSVGIVEALAREHEVWVIGLDAAEAHAGTTASGVRTLGIDRAYGTPAGDDRLLAALRGIAPDCVIMRTPSLAVTRYCLRHGIRVFPCFADSLRPRRGLRGLLDAWRTRRLAAAFRDPAIPWVGNHNLPASRALAGLGIDPGKIVPWDWPRADRPSELPAREAPPRAEVRLLCLGRVSEAKGVGDAIRALAVSQPLRSRCRLSVVGSGDLDAMRSLAEGLGVADRVDVTGPVPFAEVMPTMRTHDVLLVCSRPEYGEGMPGTVYQGFAARLPVVMSTHPVFTATFADGVDCVFAPASDPAALAAAVLRVLDEPGLYGRLSAGAAAGFARIALPVMWGDVITHWLRDDADGDAWLAARSLATYPTSRQLQTRHPQRRTTS